MNHSQKQSLDIRHKSFQPHDQRASLHWYRKNYSGAFLKRGAFPLLFAGNTITTPAPLPLRSVNYWRQGWWQDLSHPSTWLGAACWLLPCSLTLDFFLTCDYINLRQSCCCFLFFLFFLWDRGKKGSIISSTPEGSEQHRPTSFCIPYGYKAGGHLSGIARTTIHKGSFSLQIHLPTVFVLMFHV